MQRFFDQPGRQAPPAERGIGEHHTDPDHSVRMAHGRRGRGQDGADKSAPTAFRRELDDPFPIGGGLVPVGGFHQTHRRGDII